MATIKIETKAELDNLIESGHFADSVLVREPGGHTWLVYDTEDGPWALRPPHEDDESHQQPTLIEFHRFPLPLYVTTEEF